MPVMPLALGLLAGVMALAAPAPPDRIIGLLELPGLLGAPVAGGPPGAAPPPRPAPVPVYPQPDAKVPPRLTLRSAEDLPTEEYGYEAPGAVVLAVGEGWYRIRVKEGSGWVPAGSAGDFHPYERLVREGLSYLTPAWDGGLRRSPRPDARARKPPLSGPADNRPVEVLESRRVGPELWFKVRLLSHRCEAVPAKTVAEGWVPGYAPSGEPVVWFSARGC